VFLYIYIYIYMYIYMYIYIYIYICIYIYIGGTGSHAQHFWLGTMNIEMEHTMKWNTIRSEMDEMEHNI